MMNCFKTLLFSMFIALPATGWAQLADAVGQDSWKLLPEAKVDSSGIYLDQVAVAPGLTQPLPHLLLARAPHMGQTNLFSRNDMTALLQGSPARLLMTNWNGATAVRVSRRVRPLEDYDLLELLKTTLQKEYVKTQG